MGGARAPLAEKLDRSELFNEALGTRSAALFALGRRREAVMLYEGMLAFAEQTGNLRARAGRC